MSDLKLSDWMSDWMSDWIDSGLGTIEKKVPPYGFVIVNDNKYIYSLKYYHLRELGSIKYKIFFEQHKKKL